MSLAIVLKAYLVRGWGGRAGGWLQKFVCMCICALAIFRYADHDIPAMNCFFVQAFQIAGTKHSPCWASGAMLYCSTAVLWHSLSIISFTAIMQVMVPVTCTTAAASCACDACAVFSAQHHISPAVRYGVCCTYSCQLCVVQTVHATLHGTFDSAVNAGVSVSVSRTHI